MADAQSYTKPEEEIEVSSDISLHLIVACSPRALVASWPQFPRLKMHFRTNKW